MRYRFVLHRMQSFVSPWRSFSILRCLLLALVLVSGLGPAAWSAQTAASASAVRQPRQSAWEFDQVGLKGVLYPSLMLSMAKMQLTPQQQDGELGDANGLFGISVVAPRAGASRAGTFSTRLTALVPFQRRISENASRNGCSREPSASGGKGMNHPLGDWTKRQNAPWSSTHQ